jgi:transketolase
VVNIPSWEIFEAQPEDYKNQVLPADVTARLAVEAGSPFGWERYTGISGEIMGMDRFGASAPAKALFEKFGFTIENEKNEHLRRRKRSTE